MNYREPEHDLSEPDVEMRECEECGGTYPCMFGPNPFRAEIHYDYTERWACRNCDYQSSMDI